MPDFKTPTPNAGNVTPATSGAGPRKLSRVRKASPWAEPPLLAEARVLFESGASNTEVAKAVWMKFGVAVTRNAVAGISWRQGWSGARRKHWATQPRPRPAPVIDVRVLSITRFRAVRKGARGRVCEVPPLPQEPGAPQNAPAASHGTGPGLPRPLLELREGECRFPVGELFCGQRVERERGSFCAAHSARSYTKAQPSAARSLARLGGRYR